MLEHPLYPNDTPNKGMSSFRISFCKCICVGLVRHRPGKSQIAEYSVDLSYVVLIGPIIGVNTDHMLILTLGER
jgi:hypothetical protein